MCCSLSSPLPNLFLLATILASLLIATTSHIDDKHAPDIRRYGLEMVQRKGSQFVVGAEPFYFNGFNTYWLMVLAVDPTMRVKITETFKQASSVGLTVCRTWAFSDGGWRALQKSPFVYDENVFQALDFVLSEAKKCNIRLILSLTNNMEAFGGKAQYVKWGQAAGLNLTSDDDFFTNPTLKGYYKGHVKTVLNRINTFTNITYKDDPTIFAWELINEPRSPTDPSGNMLQSWIEEMAFHVKSIDPNHLLEIGLEGFYGNSTPDRLRFNPDSYSGQVGTDFIRNHQTLGIDFATTHLYPDAWLSTSIPEAQLEFTKSWMQSHIDDAEKVLGMPVVFAEFGMSAKDKNFSVSLRNQFIDMVYDNILNSTKRGGGGGGCLIWQIFPEGTDFMDDGYAVVLHKSKSTGKILSLQSKRMKMFNSMCSWRCHWTCGRKKRVSKHNQP
ncbi:mannan endo-1,4-beta-mannosidase 6-like [Phalaenopsis equestris]|uniref:mannan endo-1,4-beta-mannosidase 6-like n=1 Tax=Phalaenopsis equestris TaxID=78828 RepID=UPI0009E24F5F|nr:mannan endo-1,4-beta-mannosidase 6-like [Phalaenopsis equestris]